MMKTVQEYQRIADRERLLNSLANEEIRDALSLLELKDYTIAEIQEACRNRMNDFIDHLLTLKAIPSDHMVLYLSKAKPIGWQYSGTEKTLNLIDLNEIRKDINAPGYAFEFSDWEETLGYLVADTKLTQDYLTVLLMQYLNEISFFGTDPEIREPELDKIGADIEQGVKEAKEGHVIPAEQAMDGLAKELGLPIDEKDERKEQLRSEMWDQILKYNRYCEWRERSRILESVGIAAPTFEEAEKQWEESHGIQISLRVRGLR